MFYRPGKEDHGLPYDPFKVSDIYIFKLYTMLDSVDARCLANIHFAIPSTVRNYHALPTRHLLKTNPPIQAILNPEVFPINYKSQMQPIHTYPRLASCPDPSAGSRPSPPPAPQTSPLTPNSTTSPSTPPT